MDKWLANLKPGDEAAVECYGWQIVRIDSRTPSGMIKAAGTTYDRYGIERGATNSRLRLRPVTPAIRESIERASLLAAIRMVDWSSKPIATLRQVAAMGKEQGK